MISSLSISPSRLIFVFDDRIIVFMIDLDDFSFHLLLVDMKLLSGQPFVSCSSKELLLAKQLIYLISDCHISGNIPAIDSSILLWKAGSRHCKFDSIDASLPWIFLCRRERRKRSRAHFLAFCTSSGIISSGGIFIIIRLAFILYFTHG